jgi:hypothetical protein
MIIDAGISFAYRPLAWSPSKTDLDDQPSQPISASPAAALPITSETTNTEQTGSNANNAGNSQEDARARQQQQAYDQVIAQLQARDREVRAHEQAHLSAAGPYATGGIKYDYQTGPDGNRYAVGGSVGIDVSPVPGDPEATIVKMQVVQRAALAPAEPSGQDIKVAAQAAQQASEARIELQTERTEELNATAEEAPSTASPVSSSENTPNPPNQPTSLETASRLLLERNDFEIRLQLQSA